MKSLNPWKQLGKRYVFELYPHVKIRCDRVIQPDKTRSKYVVIERPDAAIPIAVTENEEIYLVRQWRYPVGKETLELPMGSVDKGELSLEAAKRELSEETGVTAKKWKELGKFHPATGIASNVAYVFLAEGLVEGQQKPESNEQITVSKYSYEKILELIKKGEIEDAFTITALWFYDKSRRYSS